MSRDQHDTDITKLRREELLVELAVARLEVRMVRAEIADFKLELGQKQLELDVVHEDLLKLIDRERNLTDRLLDRQLGTTSHPASPSKSELKPIGSRRANWGQISGEYETIKRQEAKQEADAKKAMWDKKVAEMDKLDEGLA